MWPDLFFPQYDKAHTNDKARTNDGLAEQSDGHHPPSNSIQYEAPRINGLPDCCVAVDHLDRAKFVNIIGNAHVKAGTFANQRPEIED